MVLPITVSCLILHFSESLWQSEISSLSKVILVLGKTKSCKAPNLAVEEVGHLADLMFHKKQTNKTKQKQTSAQDLMHEGAHCHDEAANHQLPIVAAFWIIWIVSTEEFSSLMQCMMQIRYSIHSVILNATATQYTCSLNGVYRPHWLVQWNHHCSHMCIPVHSPWLPGYIHLVQTIPIISTIAALFPDRPHSVLVYLPDAGVQQGTEGYFIALKALPT